MSDRGIVVKSDQSAFLASIVHELRAPLNACLMSVNLLELKAGDPEVVLNSVRVIRRNLERQAALIRDLSDVVQIATDAMAFSRERIRLGVLVERVLEKSGEAATEHGLELRRGTVAPDVEIETDPERTVQVLATLLEHLLAGTRPGEQVLLDARVLDGDACVAASRLSGGAASGEAPSREQHGFAVRLLVADYLLERLGGSCERRPDGFVVRLPLARAA
jgi:signal transduction histidine kinase